MGPDLLLIEDGENWAEWKSAVSIIKGFNWVRITILNGWIQIAHSYEDGQWLPKKDKPIELGQLASGCKRLEGSGFVIKNKRIFSKRF